jgi:protein SCO1/2
MTFVSTVPVAQASGAGESIYLSKGKWTHHTGRVLSLEELKGEPRVLTMIFTRCPSACPVIVNDLKRVRTALGADAKKRVRYTLFSFDSKGDTPEVLREFAKKMKIEDSQWDLFVANEEDTRELAALLGVQYKQIPSGEFVHSNVIVAVDSEGRVLAQVDGLSKPVKPLAKALDESLRRSAK